MALEELSDEILRLSEELGSTPVVVTPSYLSFREPFFTGLAIALANRTNRPIRIEWCRRLPGGVRLLTERWTRFRVARINRALAHALGSSSQRVMMELTVTFARPGGAQRPLVVGLCDERVALPPWTTAIGLGATPKQAIALQSVSA